MHVEEREERECGGVQVRERGRQAEIRPRGSRDLRLGKLLRFARITWGNLIIGPCIEE